MKLDSLRDLYFEQLDDLYSAEMQIARALPRIQQAVTAPDLRAALEIHQQETNQHIRRLEQLLGAARRRPGGEHCEGAEGLLREAFELLDKDIEPDVRDAGLLAAAQKLDHYEICGYGTARSYAKMLDDHAAAQLLQESLNEARQSDEKLNQIAMNGINLEAAET